MKAKVIVAFLFSIVSASQPAFSAVRRKLPDDEPPTVTIVGASLENAQVVADIVAAPTANFRGPSDLVRDYEFEMASIAERLSMNLRVISSAVGTGQITREQGEYASGERYHVAMMQFQLFGASAEVVVVAMPFSSLRLNPSLVEYLGLIPAQVRSIKRLMDQERPKTESLMLELQAISRELGAAIQQSQNGDNEAAANELATTKTRLLKRLVRANSRLQRKIDDVLDPQQRRKLDAFKRAGEVTVGEGN